MRLPFSPFSCINALKRIFVVENLPPLEPGWTTHLISKNKLRLPESYSDTFRVMAEEKILPVELAEEKLAAMARFRNRL